MASSAEKAKKWRQKHPVEAAAHIATLRSKRRKPRQTDTLPVSNGDTLRDAEDTLPREDTLTMEQPPDTLSDTLPQDDGQDEPQAAASTLRTTLEGARDELQEIAAALDLPQTATSRAQLRLRADVISRLAVLAERIAKLPAPTSGPDWLAEYRKPAPKPTKRRVRPMAAPSEAIEHPVEQTPAQPPGVLDF